MSNVTGLESLITSKVFDISRVRDYGQLVLPLSMAKTHSSQSPQKIYDFLVEFGDKVKDAQIDVYLIYTNGLYFNSEEDALELRKKSSSKISHHAQEFKNILAKKREFIPNAFHFLAWDSLILNAPMYNDFISILYKAYKEKSELYDAVNFDIKNMQRPVTEGNVSFVLEELAVTHIIRQKFVNLPTCLSRDSEAWRLISYPGQTLASDVVLYQKDILPKNNEKRFENIFHSSFYDWKNQKILNFDRINCIADSIKYSDKFVS